MSDHPLVFHDGPPDGPEVAIGFDGAADDVAVVVLHRTDGGPWQVESARGPASDVMALMVAAAAPAPKMPDRLPPLRPWLEQIQEWMERPARIEFDAETVERLRRLYARQRLTGALVHTSTAPASRPPGWAMVDEVWAELRRDVDPDQARRYFLNQWVDEDAERRRHP